MIKKQREKQYAVFGLGRFGTSVALTLNELGYQVMGVDTDEDNVQRKLVFLWLSLKLSIRFMEKCSKKSALIRSFIRNVIWDSV